MPIRLTPPLLTIALWFAIPCTLHAADWPMWRYDANRSGALAAGAAGQAAPALGRATIRRCKPAWPDQAKMQFDVAYEPVVARPDAVRRLVARTTASRALDTRTGAEKWTLLRRRPGPLRPGRLGGQASTSPPTTATSTASMPTTGKLALEVPRRAERPQDPRQRTADLDLAGARRPGHRRRHGLLRRQHLAVHGHLHPRPRRPHRRGRLDQRRRRLALHEAAAQRRLVRRRRAARAAGRRSATSCSSPAAARCRPASTARPASCCTISSPRTASAAAAPKSRPSATSSSTAAPSSTSPPRSTSATSASTVVLTADARLHLRQRRLPGLRSRRHQRTKKPNTIDAQGQEDERDALDDAGNRLVPRSPASRR